MLEEGKLTECPRRTSVQYTAVCRCLFENGSHICEFLPLLLCVRQCLWGNCGEGDMHDYFGWRRRPKKNQVLPSDQEIKRKYGTLERRINGELVTEASDMQQCYVLKNANGPVWKPNADGQYEITMKSNAGTNYAYWRFSSFVFL